MISTHLDGATETAQALSQAREEVANLDAAAVAQTAADVLRGFIPVKTGKAQSTIHVDSSTGARAVVAFGGSRAPHAFAIARTHPSHFVEKTDRVMEQRAAGLYEDEITDTLTRNGLTS
jgi:hypothetical protein